MQIFKKLLLTFLCFLLLNIYLSNNSQASNNPSQVLLVLKNNLSSQNSKTGEIFEAQVTEDIINENNVILEAGSRLTGNIKEIKKTGRLSQNAYIDISINEILTTDGKYISLSNSPINAKIYSPSAKKTTKKVTEKLPVSFASSGTSFILGSSTSMARTAIWGISLGAGTVAAVFTGLAAPDENKSLIKSSAQKVLNSSPAGTISTIIEKGETVELKEGQYITLFLDQKTLKNIENAAKHCS